MHKVIGFSGQAECGKDSFAEFLKIRLEEIGKKVLILHNADYLKYISKQYLNWDGNKDDKGRTLLQQLGTENIRKRYPNFHVEGVYRIIDLFQDDFDYFLISDCRFENEYEFLKEKGLQIMSVHITRDGHQNSLTPEQRSHISERALDDYKFDYNLHVEEGLHKIDEMACRFMKEVLL